MPTGFSWHTFDVASRLPAGWQHDPADAADAADFREYPLMPILAREAAGVHSISPRPTERGRPPAAPAVAVRLLPWLFP